MRAIKHISPWQFSAFRIVFGLYLVVHFVHLLPWAAELFGAQGVLPDPRLNFTFGVLPNPLEHWQSPASVQAFIGVLAALAVLFTLGIGRRTCALLLWYGWACLFNRNNLISNPGLPYVGLMLILSALVPPGEPLALGGRRNERWEMPAMIFWGAWGLLAAGYTYSGVWKLFSPSWPDGTALHHLLNNPLARPNGLREWLLSLPDTCLKMLTWGALAGELLALPLSLTRRGRAVAWLWMLAMHLGILMVVDFADLTFGMVMIHLFTFDPRWLPARWRGADAPASAAQWRRRLVCDCLAGDSPARTRGDGGPTGESPVGTNGRRVACPTTMAVPAVDPQLTFARSRNTMLDGFPTGV